MHPVALTKRAAKDFDRLPVAVRKQITLIIEGCQNDPFQFDIKKLKTPYPGYRIRSGKYRILFILSANEVQIYGICHRKDAYKR